MKRALILLALMIVGSARAELSGNKIYAEKCATCHGAKAQGDQKQQTPSLASLPGWYVTKQIGKFQKGIRGDHKEDIEGNTMHTIAGILEEKDLLDIATFIPHLAKKYDKERKDK